MGRNLRRFRAGVKPVARSNRLRKEARFS